MKPTLAAVLATALVCAAALLAGCGGARPAGFSPSLETSAQTGRATFTIRWPDAPTGRLIPLAAQSIRVSVRDSAGKLRNEQLLARPTSGNTSSLTLDPLPTGTLTVVASALPQADGTGVVQATGTAPLTVTAGKTSEITLTMESTIATLQVLVSPTPLPINTTATLSIVAKDAAGSIVLTAPSKWSFTSSRPEIARVLAPNKLEALALGTTQLTAQETESGKSITTSVKTVPDTEYAVVRINKPDETALYITANAVNSKGWVVGHLTYANGTRRPFFWKLRADRSGGDFLPVEPYPGQDATYFDGINEDGVVVGHASASNGGAWVNFHWENGVYTTLPAEMLAAFGINSSRQSVGYEYVNFTHVPLIYSGGSLTRINAMIPGSAYAINDSGVVAGHTYGSGRNQGYRYHNGVTTLLATPGDFESFQAEQINKNGTIMGWCLNGPGGIDTAGIATSNTITALPILPGTNVAHGRGISDDNTIVGSSYTLGTSENNHAVRWRNGKIERLVDLVPPINGRLEFAAGISSNGFIVCNSGFSLYENLLIPRELY